MMNDIIEPLLKTARRVGTIDRGIVEQGIAEIRRLRMVINSQGDEIRRLNAELYAIEADAQEGTLEHFDRYIAGDRK